MDRELFPLSLYGTKSELDPGIRNKSIRKLKFWDIFYTDPDFSGSDPDFSGSDPDFWPIRTQKKKSDPDTEKKPRSETLITGIRIF